MENYHLFITDENSLRFHIEFGFVGTGYPRSAFNIGIWKDIQRLKIGDKIIFYAQSLKKFFGIFRVTSNPFFDVSDPLYLHAANPTVIVDGAASRVQLRYRALISSHIVYENGIDEFELLDILPPDTRAVLWSILYRKLKGKRGNSPLFPTEYNTVHQRLALVNPNGPLNHAAYSFNQGRIVQYPNQVYNGSTARNCEVKTSIIQEVYTEHHLHALLLEAVPNQIFGPNPTWIGNEIYSGAGMQAIDLMGISVTDDGLEQYWPIEVKKEIVPGGIFQQIEKYCRWIAGRFALTNPQTPIQPILVGKRATTRQKRSRAALSTAFDHLNISLPLRYFEYHVDTVNNRVQFDEIDLTSPTFVSLGTFSI